MYQQLRRASMALALSSVCFAAFAQKTIQGTVLDANGEPWIGVTITDQNGKAGGITDLDGKFTIQSATPNTELTFSCGFSFEKYFPVICTYGNSKK